jgi:hypothetical protein
MMKWALATAGLVLAGSVLAAPAGAATIYQNDFSVGTAGTVSGGAVSVGVTGGGTIYPNTSPNGNFLGGLTQGNTANLSFAGLVPNSTVDITFNLYALGSLDGDSTNCCGSGVNDIFRATFTGNTGIDLINNTFANYSGWTQSYGGALSPSGTGSVSGQDGAIVDPTNNPDYNYYGPNHTYLMTFNNLQVSSAGTAIFAFMGFSNQGWSDEGFGIDNILVSGTTLAATPIPAALPLFLSGLGALGWAARRQRKKATVAA